MGLYFRVSRASLHANVPGKKERTRSRRSSGVVCVEPDRQPILVLLLRKGSSGIVNKSKDRARALQGGEQVLYRVNCARCERINVLV